MKSPSKGAERAGEPGLDRLVTGVAHIGIRVRELERSLKFYELLGFRLVGGPFGPERVVIMDHPSGVVINLIVNAGPGPAENVLMDIREKHPGYTHVALAVSDVDAVQRTLEAAGTRISDGPVTFPSGARSVFVRDPDRNVVEFNQEP